MVLDNDPATNRLMVFELVAGGPGADAGLEAGDMILAVDADAAFGTMTAFDATSSLRGLLQARGRITFTVARDPHAPPPTVGLYNDGPTLRQPDSGRRQSSGSGVGVGSGGGGGGGGGGSAPSGPEWPCGVCTFANPGSNRDCSMCGSPGPAATPSPRPAPTRPDAGYSPPPSTRSPVESAPVPAGVAGFLEALGFGVYAGGLAAFGVESIKDLMDLNLLPDSDLVDEVGMTHAHVKPFRAALQRAFHADSAQALEAKFGGGQSSATTKTGGQRGVMAFLDLYGLAQFKDAFADYGVESVRRKHTAHCWRYPRAASCALGRCLLRPLLLQHPPLPLCQVEDLCDPDIVGDTELATEIGMGREQIRTFREAAREAKNSGAFQILDELS